MSLGRHLPRNLPKQRQMRRNPARKKGKTGRRPRAQTSTPVCSIGGADLAPPTWCRRAVSFGRGADGQLGTSSAVTGASQSIPCWVSLEAAGGEYTEREPLMVACARSASFGVMSGGELFSWGMGFLGFSPGENCIGMQTKTRIPRHVHTPSPVTAVACGPNHCLLVCKRPGDAPATDGRTAGSVFAFGDGQHGALGHGDNNDCVTPKRIPTLANVAITSVACGANFSCALNSNGQLYTWGSPEKGQLGHRAPVTNVPSLVSLGEQKFESTDRKIKGFSCGCAHVLAYTVSGELYSWGCNSHAQTGHSKGLEGDALNCAVELPMLVDICGIEEFLTLDNIKHLTRNLVPVKIVDTAAGSTHSLCVTSTGVVFGWGSNEFGQTGAAKRKRGKNQTVKRPTVITGLPIVTSVYCGGGHSAAISDVNDLYVWGHNHAGQLGLGDTKDRRNPSKVEALMEYRVDQISLGDDYSGVTISRRDGTAKQATPLREKSMLAAKDARKTVSEAASRFASEISRRKQEALKRTEAEEKERLAREAAKRKRREEQEAAKRLAKEQAKMELQRKLEQAALEKAERKRKQKLETQRRDAELKELRRKEEAALEAAKRAKREAEEKKREEERLNMEAARAAHEKMQQQRAEEEARNRERQRKREIEREKRREEQDRIEKQRREEERLASIKEAEEKKKLEKLRKQKAEKEALRLKKQKRLEEEKRKAEELEKAKEDAARKRREQDLRRAEATRKRRLEVKRNNEARAKARTAEERRKKEERAAWLKAQELKRKEALKAVTKKRIREARRKALEEAEREAALKAERDAQEKAEREKIAREKAERSRVAQEQMRKRKERRNIEAVERRRLQEEADRLAALAEAEHRKNEAKRLEAARRARKIREARDQEEFVQNLKKMITAESTIANDMKKRRRAEAVAWMERKKKENHVGSGQPISSLVGSLSLSPRSPRAGARRVGHIDRGVLRPRSSPTRQRPVPRK